MNSSTLRCIGVSKFSSLIFLLIAIATGCGREETTPPASTAPPTPATPALEILFVYGSEKEKWVDDVTATFNASNIQSPSGLPIRVKAKAIGSGELIDDIIEGRLQAHLASPASGAFIKLGNARQRAKEGKNLFESTQNLVLSPVVIAMWKPMADALSPKGGAVGWADIIRLAQSPDGWADLGHPEWGSFKFGHTHPEFSNSGLISLMAECYAASGKVKDLSLEDLKDPKVGAFLEGIEHSVVHYGSSTGFFGRKLFSGGPNYLSAAVLYENMVIEASQQTPALPTPLVAIYPKEGTFWSDHPAAVVEKEWVTADHRAAARLYLDFLLAEPQQRKAMEYGFRPADARIALAAPIDVEHGVDPKQPLTTLEVPNAEVMDAVIKLWRQHKKHSRVLLVLDTSGSMNEESRLPNARNGASEMVKMLGDEDLFSLATFSDTLRWRHTEVRLGIDRAAVESTIASISADGGTRLYDSIADAYSVLKSASKNRINAVVVLTDGQDTASALMLDGLLSRLEPPTTSAIRVFTIGYGKGANQDVLKKIAEKTGAKFYEGTTDNIRAVFRDIATFF